MTVEFGAARDAAGERLAIQAPEGATTLTVYAVPAQSGAADLSSLPQEARSFADQIGFTAEAGALLAAPAAGDAPPVLVLGLGGGGLADALGAAASKAPAGATLALAEPTTAAAGPDETRRAALAFALGAYRYDRFKRIARAPTRLIWPEAAIGAPPAGAAALAAGVYFARDLVNTPASALGPADLAAAALGLVEAFDAKAAVTVGDDLLAAGFPMIHAVGRAGPQAPRLIDLRWTPRNLAPGAPKVTLVGKGVCFDTGGLDLKPRAGMRLMKKDMGGAAASLGLASYLMASEYPIDLRVLIPAVENSVGLDAFRPGDILTSRRGLSVEIGDTDAEGRLILADALALADEEAPDLVIDLATLTGAARVALGPDIAPFFTDDETLASALAAAGQASAEPVWRLPLHKGYDADLTSSVADICNISAGGFAGSVTAALFLRRFVKDAKSWAHFDIYCWNPKNKPGRPEGGEATAVRALAAYFDQRFAGGGGAAA